MNYSFHKRMQVVFFCFFLFALVLIVKLFSVQVINKEIYVDKADRQYISTAGDVFERGSIYLKNKDGVLISAATQTTGYKLAIDPSKIDKESAYEKISNIIDIDKEDFLAKASKANDPYEEVLGRLNKEEADAISALKISGVSLYKEKWRFYPGANLSAQTLGFVAYKDNELTGRYGLEREYENVLSLSQNRPYVNFFAEIFSDIKNSIFESKDLKKGDIITTIEPTVEVFLERVLEDVKKRYLANAVGGIVMNPYDGAIYAMSSKPDFDPNNFSKNKDYALFSNPLVENIYEFGSVVKPLVMAGALDAGVITSNTKYEDKGSVIVEKKEIFNFDKKARGVVDMQDVLSQSLNTGMVFVYKKLGKDRMKEYLLSFGINEKSGVDLPNEAGSLVSNFIKSPREIEYANASFGQGIAFSPILITRALASLANGGNLVTPHVVEKIRYKNGGEEKKEYKTKPAKISVATSEEITRMLVEVMDKGLTSGKSKLEHYSVAVKTGTAQIAKEKGGGYHEDQHLHSFFGYFPAYNPRFIIFLYAVDPKGTLYASQTWVDPFMSMVNFLINYYEVPPDR